MTLLQPDVRNTEQYCDDSLTLTIFMTPELNQKYFATFPGTGPDLLKVNYYANGVLLEADVAVTLWPSNGGWAYLGTDGKQYLIRGRNGLFFDDVAPRVVARNVAAEYAPLVPCCNEGYGWLLKIPNQVLPKLWYVNGKLA